MSDGAEDWVSAAEMTAADIDALSLAEIVIFFVGDRDAVTIMVEDGNGRRLPTIGEAAAMRDAAAELPHVLAELQRLRQAAAAT